MIRGQSCTEDVYLVPLNHNPRQEQKPSVALRSCGAVITLGNDVRSLSHEENVNILHKLHVYCATYI